MGESKRRQQLDPDYGATGFQKRVIRILDEHLEKRKADEKTLFSVAIAEGIPTTNNLQNALQIYSDWVVKQDIKGMIAFGVGLDPDTAIAVCVSLGKQVKTVPPLTIVELLGIITASAKENLTNINVESL